MFVFALFLFVGFGGRRGGLLPEFYGSPLASEPVKLSRSLFLFDCYLQSGLTMHHISSKCDLLTEDGQCVDSSTDSKVEFHFNALLDAIAEQKADSPEDKSLEGKKMPVL